MHDASGRTSEQPDTTLHPSKLYRWLSRLQSPRAPWIAIVIALLLASPTLFTGFTADDYILEYELRGPPDNEWPGTPPWNLYQLLDPEHVQRLRDGNGVPWWFYENASCGFFRTVSGFTHLFDEFVAPGSAFIAHLHSLVWLGILLLAVGWAYRSIVAVPWVAAVGCVMFALDSGHGATLSWIVNRSSFIGAVWGVLALAFHHRWRRGASARDAVLACVCLLLGLFSAELTLGILGYFAAYALFMERGSLVRRALTLLPYAPPVLLWGILRRVGGYGTEGWNVYVDPLREPLLFATLLPQRVTILLASQTWRWNADTYDILPPELRPGFLVVAFGCCVAALYFVWPTLRARAEARFWAAGAVTAILPTCAAEPSDRLLTLVGVGVVPVVAYAVYDALSPLMAAVAKRPRPRVGLAALACGLHFVVAAVALPYFSLGAWFVGEVIDRTEASLPEHPGVTEQTVIIASVPDSLLSGFLQIMRTIKGKPRPRRLYWLVATRESVHIERQSESMLRVTPGRGFYDQPQEGRARLHPLAAGARIELSDMSVHVLELNTEGRPATAEFRFRNALDAHEYVWLTWRDGKLEPWSPPAVGQSATLPAVSSAF